MANGFSGVALTELVYKADFDVGDRYHISSADLLRLSLLGIAAYGLLLSNFVFIRPADTRSLVERLFDHPVLLLLGLGGFGLSAAAAVGHRYFGMDSLSHLLAVRRLDARSCEPWLDSDSRQALIGRRRVEYALMLADFAWCRGLLAVSSLALAGGAASVAVTFGLTVLGMR